ncbi:XRE family transcriptional regulator [Actibacterium sp. MT2.3-13A]|uniref:helix-turn-helix domain-containing protein n=1 Tax=Actibacterium sp. MT2.3-13A TaxID=2828332 RepID=UPI001BA49646|nr:XRE family transcriptional regulator [Actibacterium sp. MT2.3-13A]
MSKQIGDDIRALRKSRGITLKQLAAAVGRSVGWLSQVERGQTEPSVRDLGRIAEQFGIQISFFFRSAARREEERGLVLRNDDRMPIGSSATGLTEELLSPTLSGAFELIRSTFAPRSASEGTIPARPSEDGGVLISGRLCLTIGTLQVELEPGDSFQFREQDYAWRNPGNEPAVVIWVVSPPIY